MCKAFAGSPAPTPAMMDVQAEQIDEGKDGFIYGAAPKPMPRPNKRLDSKIELFDYERWNDDWARNATNPASYAPEYESYIRQIEPTHGHDPGLIYARDFARKVEKRRGKGGEFVQSLLARLADRPDLQREFLGGAIPHHPPQGTFRPGGEAGVKDWIDQDRIANGIAPKYSKAAQDPAPVLRTSSGVAPQATEPNPKNLLEYVNNFGFPGTEPPQEAQGAQHLVPEYWPNGQPPTPEDWAFHQQVVLDEEYARRLPQAAQPSAPPETPAPAPTPGEGGAGWYDPNQMTPMPKPTVSLPEPVGPSSQQARGPSQPDPKGMSSGDIDIDLQNTQIALDATTKEVEAAAAALRAATQAREERQEQMKQGYVANAIKGAVSGAASAELRRKFDPPERRTTGKQRAQGMARGSGKGAVGATVPEQTGHMRGIDELRSAEQLALERQNRALEDQRHWLGRRDELMKERDARRSVRPDQ